jgi:hypothetical protein
MRLPHATITLLLTAAGLLPAARAQSAGDTCSSPVVLAGTGSFAWDNSLNTTSGFDGGDPSTCFSPSNTGTGVDTIRQDIFFVWTVPSSGTYQFDTENSPVNDDTKMSIHAGSDCGATCIASDDDSGAFPTFSSLIELPGLVTGDQYLIQVGSWNDSSAVGPGLLNITQTSGVPNDTCGTPQVVAGTGTFPWDNASATTSGFDGGNPGTCFSPSNSTTTTAAISRDLFFVWTVPADGTYQFDTENSPVNDDTKLAIHAGSDCAATCLAADDDGGDTPPYSSKLVLTGLGAGDSYLIQVGSWTDTSPSGLGVLNIAQLGGGGGQGDTCSNPTPIAGTGTWPFDTTGASVSGFAGSGAGSCLAGVQSMGADTFFRWTAPAAGDYRLDTCGASYDTKLAVYLGPGCGTACAGYNDDGPCGGLASEVLLSATAPGQQFLIQVGGVGPLTGTGSLTISDFTDPCDALPEDSLEDNELCGQAASVDDGMWSGLTVRRDDLDLYSFKVPAGGVFTATCTHDPGAADLDLFLFTPSGCNDDPDADPGCGTSLACAWTSSATEVLSWTNTTGSDQECVLRVSVWPFSAGSCASYDLDLAGTGASGPASFCSPANPNSTGASVTLASSGPSGPGLYHLEAEGGPTNQFGMFLVSASFSEPGLTVSQGRLCLGTPVGRYSASAGGALNSLGRFDGAGVLQNLFGTSTVGTGYDLPTTLPSPPGGSISTGSTWSFQLWYRDGAQSNFSDGLAITF